MPRTPTITPCAWDDPVIPRELPVLLGLACAGRKKPPYVRRVNGRVQIVVEGSEGRPFVGEEGQFSRFSYTVMEDLLTPAWIWFEPGTPLYYHENMGRWLPTHLAEGFKLDTKPENAITAMDIP